MLLLVFLAVVAFVLKPMLDRVKETNAKVGSSLQLLDREQRYLNSLEQSIAAAQNISPEVLSQVDRAMPRSAEIPELLVLFSTAAQRDGIRITNVTFSEPTTPPAQRRTGAASRTTNATSSAAEVQATLSVTAPSYPQIKRFFHDIEGSLRILDVVGLTAAARGDQPSYVIQAKAYYFAQ